MATTIDELNVKITATQAGFEKEIASVKSQLSSLSSYTEKSASKMSTGMVAAGTAIGGILTRVFSAAASVISSSMGDAVARVDTLNNFANVMGNLGIDSDVATKSINYMSEALQGLPTTLDDAATSVQRLVAANGNLEASTQMYLALNNAMLAGGTAQETQSAAMEQLLQAYSKGRFEMEEWRSLLVAMPAQLNQIATAMGYVDANSLYNAMQSGEVSMNDFMATAVRLNTEGVSGFASFEQQARSATNGIATSITNLKTAIARALAAIMDVIGQSNIAGFFNMVAAAIRTAGNYIAAFVKVVLTAINALRALFGQEQITFGSTAKDTDNAADAVGSIGDAADGAAGSMDNASNSAKKLKKQLASFDEMNVLQQQETGSTGGSGGSGGGGGISGDTFDVEPFNTDGLTSATDKVEAIFQGMMDALNEMFDFTTIGNAIKRFAKDVQKFLEPAGKIIDDLWNDYLKPLVSWTGNSLLPAVLNAIGGAIQFIGQILGKTWDLFLKPFIDNFVVPIAQFAGSALVGVLNLIGNALRGIAQNEFAVTMLSTLLATLLAYKGVTAIMNGVTTAIEAFRLACTGTEVAYSIMNSGNGIFATLGAAAGSLTTKIQQNGGAWNTLKTAASSAMQSISLMPVLFAEIVVAAVSVANCLDTMLKTATIEDHIKNGYVEFEGGLYEVKTAAEAEKQAQDDLNRALEDQKQLRDELSEKLTNEAEALLNMTNAQAQQAEKLEQLNQVMANNNFSSIDELRTYVEGLDVASGNLSDTELEIVRALAEYDAACGRTTEATNAYTKAKEELGQAEASSIDATMRAEHASLLEQSAAMLRNGQYQEMITLLQEASQKTVQYQDATGQMSTLSQEYMTTMVNGVAKELANLDEANASTWKSMLEDAGINVNDMSSDAISAIEEMTDSIESDVDTMNERIVTGSGGAGTDSINSFRDGIESGREALMGTSADLGANAGKQLSDNLVNYVGNGEVGMCTEGKESGEAYIDGVNSGVNNSGKQNSVFASIRAFASGMVSGLKNFLGIKSPSKVTAELGGYFTEGFAVGIEDEQNNVFKTVAHMADHAQELLNSRLQGATIDTKPYLKEAQKLSSGMSDLNVSSEIAEELSQHIIVNIGSKTIVDEVVDGINERSFLDGRTVIKL